MYQKHTRLNKTNSRHMRDKQVFLEARHQHNQAAIRKKRSTEHNHRNYSLEHGILMICLIIVSKHLLPIGN